MIRLPLWRLSELPWSDIAFAKWIAVVAYPLLPDGGQMGA
jgi:hypothetical protein